MQTVSSTKAGEARNVLSLLVAIVFFGFIVGAAIASPHYLNAPANTVAVGL